MCNSLMKIFFFIQDVDDSSRMSLGEMLTSGKLSDHKDKHKVREMPANKSGKGPTVTIGRVLISQSIQGSSF